MRFEYLGIATVALMWGGYPLISRAVGMNGPFGSLVLTLAALVPIGAAVLWQGAPVRPAAADVVRMSIAGLMMGIGLVAFIAVANSKQMEASASIPIVDTTMLIVTVIGAVVFFAEPVTMRKVIGIMLLVAGILMLKPE